MLRGSEREVGEKLKKDDAKQIYVNYYGIAASKARIESLVGQAVSFLDFLGAKADMLVQLAGLIGRRSS